MHRFRSSATFELELFHRHRVRIRVSRGETTYFLPVKVISSDDTRTDSSSHWHHSRKGAHARGTSRFRFEESGNLHVVPVAGLRRLDRQSFRSFPPGDLFFTLVTRGTAHPVRHEIWRQEALLRSKIVSTRHSRLRRFNETRTCAVSTQRSVPDASFSLSLLFIGTPLSPLFLSWLTIYPWCNPARWCFFIFE